MNSYTNHIKNEMQSTKARIMALLNWSEVDYGNFQYETGLSYLRFYIPDDIEGIDMLTRSRIFWNWWKNHWLQRDAGFISYKRSLTECKTRTLIKIYQAVHCPQALAGELRPHAIVLTETYSVMIGKLIDSTQCSI